MAKSNENFVVYQIALAMIYYDYEVRPNMKDENKRKRWRLALSTVNFFSLHSFP